MIQINKKGEENMKLKESVKNTIGIMVFFGIIIFGVIAVNARLEQQKSADVFAVQTAQSK